MAESKTSRTDAAVFWTPCLNDPGRGMDVVAVQLAHELETELAAANERAAKAEQSLASARQAAFAECAQIAYDTYGHGKDNTRKAIERAAQLPPSHVCLRKELTQEAENAVAASVELPIFRYEIKRLWEAFLNTQGIKP